MQEPIAVILFILIAISIFFALWKIVKKTGNPGIVSIFFFIPLLNIALLYYLAFSKWPLEEVLERYKKKYSPIEEEKGTLELSQCPNCSTPRPTGAEKCVLCDFAFS